MRLMSPMDWQGTRLPSYGHYYYYALLPRAYQIIAKYRAIAPKPTVLLSYPCNSNSDFSSALDFRSIFTTSKGNNGTERGRPSRTRGKASGYRNNPSHRGQKRKRDSNYPRYLKSNTRCITRPVAGSIGAEIVNPFDAFLSAEKLSVGKDSDFTKKAADNVLSEGIVLDKKAVVNIKGLMDSIGKPAQRMPAGVECGCGECFGSPIFSDIEEKRGNNPVTLPLFPKTLSLKDSDLGYPASNSTSIVGHTVRNPSRPYASSGKEEIQFRLFGIDIRQNELGPC